MTAKNGKTFEKKYLAELKTKSELLSKIKSLESEKKLITLFFSARDDLHNDAVILHEELTKK
jgi:uncharacterized protein YeaO (DUF488 family)